jgi:hypothetical protein
MIQSLWDCSPPKLTWLEPGQSRRSKFHERGERFSFSWGEKAGMRADVKNHFAFGVPAERRHFHFDFSLRRSADAPPQSHLCKFHSGPASGVCRMGERPNSNRATMDYLARMNILLLMLVLLLLFGGGGFYFGGPVIGGSGLGLVLAICLVVYLLGGFRPRSS